VVKGGVWYVSLGAAVNRGAVCDAQR
jgi:hypothetical protein